MASLKEIKGRIASIQSMQKITSAMRMVASAKLHRTQGMTENFLRYKDTLHGIMDSLQNADSGMQHGEWEEESFSVHDNFAAGKSKCVLLIPVSSNSGLCGAFNSNIAKATMKRISELEQQGSQVMLMPVGKKIVHDLQREGKDADAAYSDLMEKVEKGDGVNASSALMKRVTEMYRDGKIQSAEFIFHHFKSMGSQVITIQEIMLQMPKHVSGSHEYYITEPSSSELIASLFPLVMNAEAYGTMLDSLTSEHAARMMAMQTADDNANELLRDLTLLYNKTRQQAITNELIDIMGSKVNG